MQRSQHVRFEMRSLDAFVLPAAIGFAACSGNAPTGASRHFDDPIPDAGSCGIDSVSHVVASRAPQSEASGTSRILTSGDPDAGPRLVLPTDPCANRAAPDCPSG